MAEPGDRAVPDRQERPGASEALDFEPVTRKKGYHSLNLKLFFSLVALTVFGGGGAWYFYGDRLAGDVGDVPIIRAAEGPVKVRPDNPGGMAVPDRDKLIYDRMQGLENRPTERLLPPPEIPLTPPGTETAKKTETAPVLTPPPAAEPPARPTTEEVLAAKPPSPAPLPPQAAAKKPAPVIKLKKAVKPKMPVAKPMHLSPTPRKAPVTAKATPKTVSPAVPPAVPMARPMATTKKATAAYRVQLAAVRTQERAREEWSRLQKQHSALLGSLSLSLTRADLGKKGIFYRLRAGPLVTEKAARDLCGKLVKRKVGCMIVRPEK